MVQEIEVEMRKHKESVSQNRKTIDVVSSQMVITDTARKGEVKTIGDVIGKEEELNNDGVEEATEDKT